MSCGRKIGNFDCCSIVCGDCLELMKQLSDRLICECGADVTGEGGIFHAIGGHENHEVRLPEIYIVSDPPYGIPILTNFALGPRGKVKVDGREFPAVTGNDKEFDPSPFLRFPCILWGANHYAHKLPHNGRWLVWDKRCGIIPERTQADCEMAWCSEYGAARMFRHVWDGMVKDSERGIPRQHPTQKPEELMAWCLEHVPENFTVVDPYSGSGTTLVAAKKLGRHFLGFEISPEYCEITRKRLDAIDAQPSLFAPKPEQLTLGGGDV